MSHHPGLARLLDESARSFPGRPAAACPGGVSLNYLQLAELSDRFRDRLWHLGVRPGDRVGLRLHKGIDSLAAIFGILKLGAAYVPIDAESPVARGAYILNNCQVKALLTEQRLAGAMQQELDKLDATPAVLALPDGLAGLALPALLDDLQRSDPAAPVPTVDVGNDDIAYILYTSGSTGNPKGVVLTHGNALSFIDWCSEVFQPHCEDTFSSHAPFHFDLSILDIYVAIKHGARLVLIGEEVGKDPLRLAAMIAAERITIWYSTPSILSLLANFGKLERHDHGSLRIVLFAGEVFPLSQFALLIKSWASPRYFNLYGPTETNVCTYYEVPRDDSWKRMNTFPIGRICPPNRGKVVDDTGEVVSLGDAGELLVAGPNVMQGYWNLPEQNARAFARDDHGVRWYRTGDIVREGSEGDYIYLSRRDRMVKRRGYRIELGEIETGLMQHPDIREAAVVAVPDAASGVRIAAFVSSRSGERLGIIALKSIASKFLPPYMIPDLFLVLGALPRTSTDKIDYQTLKASL
jgi:amino acid adenylation domain-containing protein